MTMAELVRLVHEWDSKVRLAGYYVRSGLAVAAEDAAERARDIERRLEKICREKSST